MSSRFSEYSEAFLKKCFFGTTYTVVSLTSSAIVCNPSVSKRLTGRIQSYAELVYWPNINVLSTSFNHVYRTDAILG